MCPHLSNYARAVIFQGFLLSPCSEHCRMYMINSSAEILFLRSNLSIGYKILWPIYQPLDFNSHG